MKIQKNKYENDKAIIEHFIDCKTDILFRYVNDPTQTQQIIALTFLMYFLGLMGLIFVLWIIIDLYQNNKLTSNWLYQLHLNWVYGVYLIPVVLSYLHMNIGTKTLTQNMIKDLAELSTLSSSTRLYIAQLLDKKHVETNPKIILKKIYQYLSIQGQLL